MNSLSPPRDFFQFGFHVKNSCLCLPSVLKSLSALNNSDPFNPWCKIYRSINLVGKSLTTIWMDCNDNSYTHTCVCVCVHVYVCVCVQRDREIDLCPSKRIWGRILLTQIQLSKIQIQDPLRWSWSILFQVPIYQKSSILNIFCKSIKRRKMDGWKWWVG